jgi:hypothetical protein
MKPSHKCESRSYSYMFCFVAHIPFSYHVILVWEPSPKNLAKIKQTTTIISYGRRTSSNFLLKGACRYDPFPVHLQIQLLIVVFYNLLFLQSCREIHLRNKTNRRDSSMCGSVVRYTHGVMDYCITSVVWASTSSVLVSTIVLITK